MKNGCRATTFIMGHRFETEMDLRLNPVSRNRYSGGFTLVEVLLTVALMGLLATGITAVYSTGIQSLDYQADRMLLDGKLRSRMELLLSTDVDALSDGSETAAINGKDFTINWTVATVDLNTDGVAEPDAKKITVSAAGIPGATLTTVVVDSGGMVGKVF